MERKNFAERRFLPLVSALLFFCLAFLPLSASAQEEPEIDLLAALALEIARLAQHAVEPRRGHLQNVGVGDEVLAVKNLLQPLTQRLAVLNVDAALLVDVDAQIPIAFTYIFDVYEFQFRLHRQEIPYDLLDALLDLRAHRFPLYPNRITEGSTTQSALLPFYMNERVGFHPLFPRLK